MAPALIEAEGIVKDYTLGTRKVHALRGCLRPHRVRRVRRRDGSLGLGQVHLHEPPRLPRHAERRALRPRRGQCLEPGDGRPRPDPKREDRIRLPDVQPAPADVGPREHRAAAALQRGPGQGAGAAIPGQARRGGPGRPGRPSPGAALGRPATARGHRAGPDQQPGLDPGRRADRRARQPDERRDHGALPGPEPHRHHHRARHARARCRPLCHAEPDLPRWPVDQGRGGDQSLRCTPDARDLAGPGRGRTDAA